MHVILYARFSPRPNAEECESCKSQLAEMRAWAEASEFEIRGEFWDDALSGGDDWEDRAGLLDAEHAAKRGDLFVVLKLDRLFRDTRKALMFRALLEAKGVKLVSLTEPAACEETPESRLMATLLLGLAEYQREMIRARTRAKMRQHQANGRKMGGHPPYGKRCEGKRLVDDEYELQVCERVLTLHAEGVGPREICRQLHRENRKPRGKRWRPETIARILRRLGEDARAWDTSVDS